MSNQRERWILTPKELHLGYCKETFRAGAVIELDEATRTLYVDGRKFTDTRDLDVLKRQASKDPDKAWIVPYTPEARQAILAGNSTPKPRPARAKSTETMKIVESDEDLTEPIDIRDTKVSAVNKQKKEASKDKIRTDGMEVIRGDETVEERLAELKGKTDLSSLSERVRLKDSGATRMPIVRDDSSSSGFDSKTTLPLNAGQRLPSREEADAKQDAARAAAQQRKQEAQARREAANPDAGAESSDVAAPPSEIDVLRSQVAELMKANQELTAKAASRKPGRPKKVVAA